MIAQDAPLPYRLLQGLLYALLRLLAQLDVTGVENVPSSGPIIIAPNHIHILDSVVIFAVIHRRMVVFAADKWRRTPYGYLLKLVAQAIYVARGEVDRHALTLALAALRAGAALGIAPEGTRSRTRGLQQGKDGAAYLAARSGAAIVPVAVWGQETTFSSWRHFHRPLIHVRIAEPLRLPEDAAQARAAELSLYTEQIMRRLASLLPAQYQGVYTSRPNIAD
jgi:1-acyl-sn-glycerol-3-phosphate acyltransferase